MAGKMDDPLAPERFEQFFRELYWLKGEGLDKHGILKDLDAKGALQINFRTAARKFHLIDESQQVPVLVRFEEGEELVESLIKNGPERWLLRKLQRYVINIPYYLHQKLLADGSIREISPGIYAQGHMALYHPELGFCPDRSVIYAPDELVG